jgi:hypothetical protein
MKTKHGEAMHEINIKDQGTAQVKATNTSTTTMLSPSIAGSTVKFAGAESTFSGSTTKYDFWLVPPATEKSGDDSFHRCFTTFSSVAANGNPRGID